MTIASERGALLQVVDKCRSLIDYYEPSDAARETVRLLKEMMERAQVDIEALDAIRTQHVAGVK